MGNLTSHTDGGGAVTYAYNTVNLVQTLTEPGGFQTSFTYDTAHRRTQTSYPSGVMLNQTYDNSGRLTSMVGKNGAGTVLTSFSYTYVDPSKPAGSQDTSLRKTMTDASGNVTTYSYDVLNRLSEAQTKNSGGSVISDFQYGYDGAGNRIGQSGTGGTVSYTYTAADAGGH